MKKQMLFLSIIVMVFTIIACGKKWTCSTCGKTWVGKAYTDWYMEATMCEECAAKYWMPLPYENYEIGSDLEISDVVEIASSDPGNIVSDTEEILEMDSIVPDEAPSDSVYYASEEDFIWTLTEHDELYITEYIGRAADTLSIIIPETIEGKSIDRIAFDAFAVCDTYIDCQPIGLEDSILIEASEADFDYLEKRGEAIILSYLGDKREVNIPMEIHGMPVIHIGEECFSYSRVTKVSIPHTVEVIADSAFGGCANLSYIRLPKELKEIGRNAFVGCDSLAEVRIPEGCEKLGWSAFRGKYITSPTQQSPYVYVPASVTTIELWNETYLNQNNDFMYCLVETPFGSHTQQMFEAKKGSTGFNKTTFNYYTYCDGEFQYREHETHFEVSGYVGSSNNPAIPSQINGKPVKEIMGDAFEDIYLEGIEMPNSITQIGAWAFSGMDLKSIVIPGSCEIITENFGLDSCDYLSTIEFSEGVRHIEWSHGVGERVTEIYLPSTLEYIDLPCTSNYIVAYVANDVGEQWAIGQGIDYERI